MNINRCLEQTLCQLNRDEEKYIVKNFIHQLLIEHQKNDKSGIYGNVQYMFAYHSNHMEGNRLTLNQTRHLFWTGTLPTSDEVYVAKDIEEAQGHFLMFNEMLHHFDEPLSEELIKRFHYKLKQGVFEDLANGYPCGQYKNRVNFVGDIETTHPADVEQSMQSLLVWYASQPKTLEILLAFHAKYEKIHPFQDGNGRTGRIILFKECLKHQIMPVIYTESVQRSYKEALNHAQKTDDFNSLIQISKQAQEIYYKELQLFLYNYSQSNKTE